MLLDIRFKMFNFQLFEELFLSILHMILREVKSFLIILDCRINIIKCFIIKFEGLYSLYLEPFVMSFLDLELSIIIKSLVHISLWCEPQNYFSHSQVSVFKLTETSSSIKFKFIVSLQFNNLFLTVSPTIGIFYLFRISLGRVPVTLKWLKNVKLGWVS